MITVMKKIIRKSPFLYEQMMKIYPFVYGVWGLCRGRRGAKDHLHSTYSDIRRSSYIHGRPINITIEPTNMCNLRCPVCETGAGVLGRKDGHMSFEQFKTIIDKVSPHTNILMFYYMGEPFLNKESYRMIRYAKGLGIPWVTTCTNGDPVNPQKLVESDIDEVSFQIGGMSQETHQIYRINSKLDRVLKNMKDTISIKRETGSKIKVKVGFILMKHNEHEVDEFKKKMEILGVDEFEVVDPCVRTVEQGLEMLPTDKSHWYYDVAAFQRGELKPKTIPDNQCHWIYYSMTIQVNGDVVPCCRDPKGEEIMGNLLSQNLDDVWNGEPYQRFRERILTDQGSVEICKLCSGYGQSEIK